MTLEEAIQIINDTQAGKPIQALAQAILELRESLQTNKPTPTTEKTPKKPKKQ